MARAAFCPCFTVEGSAACSACPEMYLLIKNRYRNASIMRQTRRSGFPVIEETWRDKHAMPLAVKIHGQQVARATPTKSDY